MSIVMECGSGQCSRGWPASQLHNTVEHLSNDIAMVEDSFTKSADGEQLIRTRHWTGHVAAITWTMAVTRTLELGMRKPSSRQKPLAHMTQTSNFLDACTVVLKCCTCSLENLALWNKTK